MSLADLLLAAFSLFPSKLSWLARVLLPGRDSAFSWIAFLPGVRARLRSELGIAVCWLARGFDRPMTLFLACGVARDVEVVGVCFDPMSSMPSSSQNRLGEDCESPYSDFLSIVPLYHPRRPLGPF